MWLVLWTSIWSIVCERPREARRSSSVPVGDRRRPGEGIQIGVSGRGSTCRTGCGPYLSVISVVGVAPPVGVVPTSGCGSYHWVWLLPVHVIFAVGVAPTSGCGFY